MDEKPNCQAAATGSRRATLAREPTGVVLAALFDPTDKPPLHGQNHYQSPRRVAVPV